VALFEAVAKVLAWAYDARSRSEAGPLPELDRLPTEADLARV
jgi:hypothetical protein